MGERTSLKTLNNSQEAEKPSVTKQKAPSDTYALRYAVNGSYRKRAVDGQEEDEMTFIIDTDALIYPFS